jgi:hypothetical protein
MRIAFTSVGVSALIKHLAFIAMLLLGANALSAASFDFSFSGSGVSASGVLTATSVGLGTYDVTGVTGTQGSKTLSDGGGSSFTLAGSSVFLATLNFDLPSHGSESVGDFFGIVSGSGLASNVDYLSITSVSSVPEPAVLLLLLTMGLGVWLFGRKVLSKSTP